MTDTAYPDQIEDEFFDIIDNALNDIKGTSITSTSEMLDVLLDLRSCFDRYKEQQKTIKRSLYDIVRERSEDATE